MSQCEVGAAINKVRDASSSSLIARVSSVRDRLVKMLQAELECLRGPLTEDDLPSEPPCLIHIWIPSAFLTGQPSDIHHVYQVLVISTIILSLVDII